MRWSIFTPKMSYNSILCINQYNYLSDINRLNLNIMKKTIFLIASALFISLSVSSQTKDVIIRVHPEQGNQLISKHIYGHFAEHLGSCIYGGLWVGENSSIPNTQGYRTDVLEALKKTPDPQSTLARRLLCRRIPLDGWNRSPVNPS